MSRMDKYDENIETSDIISRQAKNQDMYKDVYLNNTFVDYGELNEQLNKKETIIEEEIVTVTYEEKNYNVNDYLMKARENRVNDNVMRSLDNTDCEVNKVKDKEDEISKLIDSIEKKEKESDFFSELLPDDDDNTVITDPVPSEKLDNVIDDEALYNYAMANSNIEEKEFQDILEEKSLSKKNKLPLIIFFITLFLLIAVIIVILVLK